MQVNTKKTQILCISSETTSEITSYIRTSQGEITSGKSLKILGFYFDNRPNAVYHVTQVINAFFNKLWTLRFLKRTGMEPDSLLKVYFTVIRAAVEYCSSVYHSLIPGYMAERLEKIQRRAIRIIYGRGVDVDKMVEDGKLETLERRRELACMKFARKASTSERFGNKWFPKNPETGACDREQEEPT